MSDLLHDVDEMMRAERLRNLWLQYGNYIIGGVLAVIIAVAAQQGYQSWAHARAEKTGAALIDALKSADPAVGLEKMAQGSGPNAAAMARILRAQTLTSQKNTAAAVADLLSVRNDARAHRDLRDLATLLWVRVQAESKEAKLEDLKAALRPLMADEGRPFAWAARLDLAVLTAHGGDLKGAVDLLAPMRDHPALPATQTERARALYDLYAAGQE